MMLGDCSLEEIYNKVKSRVHVSEEGIPHVEPSEELEELKECVISLTVGGELKKIVSELEEVKKSVERLVSILNLKGFTYPREFSSFINDPMHHLKKKLFNYVYDLIRGKISLEEFTRRASAAVRTSVRTNMRTAYQIWGITSIMAILAEKGFTLSYPEHGFINFDRSGKQRLGIIPPNAILFSFKKGFISIFHEAPRPIAWEDTSDLKRIWKLYTALRPDVMVYGGAVFNIVNLDSDPPIARPDVIIEFKELNDWYERVRDLRGYFRKPLTAEEWRSKWLEGLFEGLADIMGISRVEAKERVEEAKPLRIREYQLIRLYKKTYKPKKTILVSRCKLPSTVKKELEEAGITVYDNIGFNARALEPVAKQLEDIAKFSGSNVKLVISPETAELLARAIDVLGLANPDTIIRKALERMLNHD